MKGYMKGETFAFEGGLPNKMRYVPRSAEEVRLYALSIENKVTREFRPGKDFAADVSTREIRALPGGEIPDRRNHAYYGHVPFDHEDFPDSFDYGNYMLYADYPFECPDGQTDEALARKYAFGNGRDFGGWIGAHRGRKSRMLLFGDSITEGLDCVRGLRYFERLQAYFASRGAEVEIVNRAVGGECSRDGLRRLSAVAEEESDLTIVAYGMNDQNFHNGANGIALEEYERNIREIADTLSQKTDNILLVAPALCNAQWVHRSPNVGSYAQTLSRIAKERGYGFAAVTPFWREIQSFGKTDACMLANGINHPGPYGHYLYYCVIKALFENAEQGGEKK